jgi:hypothetical protein
LAWAFFCFPFYHNFLITLKTNSLLMVLTLWNAMTFNRQDSIH